MGTPIFGSGDHALDGRVLKEQMVIARSTV